MIVESKIENPKSKIGMRADPKWLNLELPGSPVPWTTAAVGHGENLNRRFCNPINYAIGETAEEIPLRSVQVHRPSLRSALHLTDRVIELGYESICREEIALGIPLIARASAMASGWSSTLGRATSPSEDLTSRDGPRNRLHGSLIQLINTARDFFSPLRF